MRVPPDFSREAAIHARGLSPVAGVDEVGRGPLAGPVVAGAVVLDPLRIPPGVDDSKRLTARRREALAQAIRESAAVGVGEASAAEVDRLGIVRATDLAMARAVAALPVRPSLALVDGRHRPPNLGCPAEPLVGGDRLSLSVAAASVVAKVWRDELMRDFAQQHPGYGWETNVGYGSESHIRALHRLGPTPIHRRTFAPLRNIL